MLFRSLSRKRVHEVKRVSRFTELTEEANLKNRPKGSWQIGRVSHEHDALAHPHNLYLALSYARTGRILIIFRFKNPLALFHP